MAGRIPSRITVVLATTFACLLVLAGQAQAAPPGLIAFGSNRDGNEEIYTMNADGSNQTNITTNPASDGEPAWSPDNTRLAFTSNRDGNDEIYTMNADGSGQTRITYDPGADFSPVWFPDGRRIAFVSDRDGITDPAGTFFHWEIYTMNADGSGQTNITNILGRDYDPDVSPDGRSIVFATGRDAGCVFVDGEPYCTDDRIYVMDSDGSNPILLASNASRPVYDPAFSPDGQTIAFAKNFERHFKIYTMNADGSNQTRIDNAFGIHFTESFSPSFSPDGARLAFESSRDGNSEIYTMGSDGSNVIRLTNNAVRDSDPAWQHGPNRMAYNNAAQFCKAERAFWGDQFASRYGGGANAYGKCISQNH